MNLKHFLFLSLIILFSNLSYSQVKIGDTTGAPDPKAILELKDTTRGFLLPRMTTAHMNAITSPTNGLLVFNNTNNSIYQYNQAASQWRPIVADSSEWYFDAGSSKLYLRRALNNADSFYYSASSRKFMFADTRFYKTSSGGVFNLDEDNSDRFIFKTTASRFPRPLVNLNSANLYSVYEVDNDTIAVNNPFMANYLAGAFDATVIQSATQKIGLLTGLRAFATFAGADTLSVAMGLQTAASLRGKGHVELAYGINNTVGIRDSITNIGLVYGIQNNISYTSPLGTPRVAGNVYGYFSNISAAMNGKVDGNSYGIFLGNVFASGVGVTRNWALFTNKGMNRFGDSVVVTDGGAPRARAVFDVNATSAMIIPVGNTVQRPATTYTGMLRYNTDNATPEAYTGTAWVNLKSPVLSVTAVLDPPSIASGATGSAFYSITGAAFGNTVTISPDVALPSGLLIAWARVSGVNQIEVGFGNISGAAIDLPAQNFYIKLVQ